jgi:hypothetical protein
MNKTAGSLSVLECAEGADTVSEEMISRAMAVRGGNLPAERRQHKH